MHKVKNGFLRKLSHALVHDFHFLKLNMKAQKLQQAGKHIAIDHALTEIILKLKNYINITVSYEKHFFIKSTIKSYHTVWFLGRLVPEI